MAVDCGFDTSGDVFDTSSDILEAEGCVGGCLEGENEKGTVVEVVWIPNLTLTGVDWPPLDVPNLNEDPWFVPSEKVVDVPWLIPWFVPSEKGVVDEPVEWPKSGWLALDPNGLPALDGCNLIPAKGEGLDVTDSFPASVRLLALMMDRLSITSLDATKVDASVTDSASTASEKRGEID